MIDRRTFLAGGASVLLAPAALARSIDREMLLQQSEYAYISPLLADGSESTCHGEVWYAWLDGAVVVITGSDRWKARALRKGLDRARIWIGNHGRWKQLFGKNEAFRQAPRFDARVEVSKDAKLLDRMLAVFEKKYPEEIGDWRDKMRGGFADDSRTLLRYVL